MLPFIYVDAFGPSSASQLLATLPGNSTIKTTVLGCISTNLSGCTLVSFEVSQQSTAAKGDVLKMLKPTKGQNHNPASNITIQKTIRTQVHKTFSNIIRINFLEVNDAIYANSLEVCRCAHAAKMRFIQCNPSLCAYPVGYQE